MAPSSPRRSSRARTTNSQTQQSSGSSYTSGRLERNTRSLVKLPSSKSTPSASLSSEPLDDIDDTLLSRRRKRAQDDEQDKNMPNQDLDMADGTNDLQDEEDEAVRCICCSEEYPGRPPVNGPEAHFFTSIELTEDVTGFFVQCDVCKVWQHGACVGIFSAESSPDEYFCEQCRKDLHKIHTASNGQRYSKYVPLNRPSRNTSRATSIAKDGCRSPKIVSSKSIRPNSGSQTSKRRSTMNSRDAAYDDEQLRRAIEASKEETTQDGAESTSRRTKRGRSHSIENITNFKRQRTGSCSVSPPLEQTESNTREVTDDERKTHCESKRLGNGRNQEKFEKDEKERLRQETASKRKGRAHRRRTEDSDMSEEISTAGSKSSINKSIELTNVTEPMSIAPPGPYTPPAIGITLKKASRSVHKKGKGKNQYSKDRVVDNEESPACSTSRDMRRNMDENPVAGQTKFVGEHKPGPKAKSIIVSKMSMVDMKRRVAAIMEFISRTQVDLATEASISRDGDSTTHHNLLLNANTTDGRSCNKSDGEKTHNSIPKSPDKKGFKELNCMEMMDVITRDMVKWQSQYA